MYHSISEKNESQIQPYYRTTTAPSVFAEQMHYLHEHGYRTCYPTEALDCVQENHGSTKRLVITFDDGFADFYQVAFPAMDRYGFRATVYLPTAYIGNTRGQFKGKECLTWDDVRELSRCGIQFGSHTVTHPLLRALRPAAVNEEIAISKKTIEDKLGRAVESFAYPYAFPQSDSGFKQMLRDSLEGAGYQNGVCTIVGRASHESDRFFLERLPINSADDSALLEAKLIGDYDWVGKAQQFSKFANSRMGKLRPSKANAVFSSAC